MNDGALRETSTPYHTGAQASPYDALAEELYRERVIRARHTPPEDKILAGQRLFESACEITLLGIRNQNPGMSEERCREILRERLAVRRRMEQAK